MVRSHAAELAASIADVASTLDVRAVDADGAQTYLVGKIVIVAVGGATAEFRLRADVAAAAARTPDAAPSPRGPEWVAFTPTSFDRFTRDRITSWFEYALRQAQRS